MDGCIAIQRKIKIDWKWLMTVVLGKNRKNSKSFIELIRIRFPPTLSSYLDVN